MRENAATPRVSPCSGTGFHLFGYRYTGRPFHVPEYWQDFMSRLPEGPDQACQLRSAQKGILICHCLTDRQPEELPGIATGSSQRWFRGCFGWSDCGECSARFTAVLSRAIKQSLPGPKCRHNSHNVGQAGRDSGHGFADLLRIDAVAFLVVAVDWYAQAYASDRHARPVDNRTPKTPDVGLIFLVVV